MWPDSRSWAYTESNDMPCTNTYSTTLLTGPLERNALSVAETAATNGVSAGFIRLEIKRGHLKAVRAGRRVLVPVRAIEEWLKQPK
jgi:excisionase family DNA binding protein